jgi:hypothetical protein
MEVKVTLALVEITEKAGLEDIADLLKKAIADC